MSLDNVATSVFAVDVKEWRETYARPSTTLSNNLSAVKTYLTEKEILRPEGFVDILKTQKVESKELEICQHVAKIVKESQGVLCDLPKTAEFVASYSQPSSPQALYPNSGIFLINSNEESTTGGSSENTEDRRMYNSVLARDFEKKQNSSIFYNDVKKVIGAATSTLHNDPCRRFVFAMTLEGSHLRMWYFCRSHIAISHPFDFHKEQDDFLLFLLYLVSASKEELGFDPTVVRVSETVFRYKVGDVYYETVGSPLSEEAVYHVCSPSTRVWKVRKVVWNGEGWREDDNDKEPHVLKDVWLYHGSKMEKDIQDRIFATFNEQDLKKVRPHFLTILHDVEVSFYTTGVQGKDITPIAPTLWIAKLDPTSKNRISTGSRVDTAAIDRRAPAGPFQHSPGVPKSRIHVRTVFKECCEAVYNIEDLTTFAQCIDDAIVGLNYLRQAGFIHRDISGGNILWYAASRPEEIHAEVKDTGIGKIADLEYCRLYDSSNPNGPITGTPYFLPVEYSTNSYLFFPTIYGYLRKGVSFNFYHDLESLIWVYVWFVFNRVPSTISTVVGGDLKGIVTSVRTSASRWFELSNTEDRKHLIEGGCRSEWLALKKLYALSSTDAPFLDDFPLVIRQSFAFAQIDLQETQPDETTRRWPRGSFKDIPYIGFRKYIAKHFKDLAPLPVMRLSEVIPASEPEDRGGGRILRTGSKVVSLPSIPDVDNEGNKQGRNRDTKDAAHGGSPADEHSGGNNNESANADHKSDDYEIDSDESSSDDEESDPDANEAKYVSILNWRYGREYPVRDLDAWYHGPDVRKMAFDS